MKFSSFLFLIFILFFVKNSTATHIMGGEITWKCTSTGEYQIYFSVYRDCSGSTQSPLSSGTLKLHNYPIAGSVMNIPFQITNGSSGEDLSPSCYTGGPSFDCFIGRDSRAVNVFKCKATNTLQLNGVPPTQGWVITYDDFARNPNNNLASSNPGLTLRAKILKHSGSVMGECTDNSPTFREKPTSLVCIGDKFSYNHNASDVEQDSLAFKWAKPLDDFAPNSPNYVEGSSPPVISFSTGYSYNSPFPSPNVPSSPNNVAAVLDSTTGEITLTSYDVGKFVSVIQVTAYKCGEPVAEIYREMQSVFTNTCQAGNTKPVLDPIFPLTGTATSFADTFKAGDLINFDITASDTGSNFNPNGQPQKVSIEVTGIPFGTNYTNANAGCPDPPCATLSPVPPGTANLGTTLNFNWQTACNHVSGYDACVPMQNTYTFIVRTYDDACPVPAEKIQTIAITLITDSVIESPDIQCVNVQANGDVDLDWNLPDDPKSSFTAWMIYSATSANGPFSLIDSVKNYTDTQYTHVGANAHTQQRWYSIRSRSGCGGNVLNVSKDTVSTLFLQSNSTTSCLNISWDPLSSPNPTGSASQYDVYREYPIGSGMQFYKSLSSTSICDFFSGCSTPVRYRVELKNTATGCVSSSVVHNAVMKYPDPIANFNFTAPCGTTAVTFSDKSSISVGTIPTWDWDFGDGNSSTQKNPVHSYSNIGSYQVKLTVTSGNGCTDDTTITVSPYFPPTDAGPAKSICAGDTVRIGTAAISGLSYTWTSDPNNNSIDNPNVAQPYVFPNDTTEYTVTTLDANGCSDTSQVLVSVVQSPLLDAGKDTSICAGDSVILGGSPTQSFGNVGWKISGSSGFFSLSDNPKVFPTASTVYVVVSTSSSLCVATDTVIVKVSPLPFVNVANDTSICLGSSVDLGGSPTGPIGATYLWTNNVNSSTYTTSNPIVNPTVSTKYKLLVESANGCIAEDSVSVSVNPIPPIDAGSDRDICAGDQTVLGGSPTSSTGSTYLWTNNVNSTSSTLANPSVSPMQTTTYTVVASNAAGCTNSDQVSVTVNPLPIVDAGSNVSICAGNSVILGGSPTGPTGSTYLWTNNVNSSTSSLANPSVSPNQTTTYTVEVTDANGCANTDQITVTVIAIPTADAGKDTSICNGGTATLGGNPTASAGSVEWRISGSTSVISTSSNPIVSPSSTTLYSLEVNTGPNCIDRDSILVTVNPLPTADAGSDRDICLGDNTILGGSPSGPSGANYLWTNNINSTTSSQANPSVSPSVTTTYNLLVTDTNGCSSNDQVTISVFPYPTLDAGKDTAICLGGTAILGGNPTSSAANLEWRISGSTSVFSTSANPSVSPNSNTIYVVEASVGPNCSQTDTVQVVVNPLPVVDAGSDRGICIGGNTILGGSPSGPSGSTFLWTNNINSNSSSLANPTVSPNTTTIYTLLVSDANGCSNTDDVEVIVNPLPIVDAGSNVSICKGSSVLLGGSPTGPTGSTYQWTNNVNSSTSSLANPSVSPNQTTTYTVEVTDVNGCTDTDQITVTVIAIPTADAGKDTSICNGGTATLGGNPTASTGSVEWRISGSTSIFSTSSNPTVNPSSTTLYTLEVNTGPNCIDRDSILVTVNPLPTTDAGSDRDICLGDNTILGGSPSGPTGATYLWTNNINSTTSSQANPSVSPNVTTTYNLLVTDTNGCFSNDQVTVTVFPYPTVDAGKDTAICLGGTAILGGSPTSSAASLEWRVSGSTSVFSTSANPSVSPNSNAIYVVEASVGPNCSQTDTIQVVVNPLPVVDAGSDRSICLLDSTTLGGSPTGPTNASYLWTNNINSQSSNLSNPKVSPAVSTIYTVQVTDVNSCVSTDDVTVTVNPLPTVDAGNDTSICINTSINLGGNPTGPSNASYKWTNNVDASVYTDANPLVSPTQNTIYYLEVSDVNACKNYDTIEVSVNPLPLVDAGPDKEICFMDSIQIGGSPTAPLGSTYSWEPAALILDPSVSNPIVFPTSDTTFYVLVTDVNSCVNMDSVKVKVNPLPLIDAGSDAEICRGDTVQIGGSPSGPPSASFKWSPALSLDDATTSNPNAFPKVTTLYKLEVMDLNACISEDSMMVEVNPLADVDFEVENTCFGDFTAFKDKSVGNIISWSWDFGDGVGTSNQQNPGYQYAAAGSYYVSLTVGTDENCDSTLTKQVVINALPNINAGGNPVICYGDSARLGGTPTGPMGSTYSWFPALGLSDPTSPNPWAFPKDTTKYYLSVTDVNSCIATDSILLSVNQLPDVKSIEDTSVCKNIPLQLITSGAVSYQWKPNSWLNNSNVESPISTPLKNIEYIVLGTDINGCENSDTVKLEVFNIETRDTNMCSGDSVPLTYYLQGDTSGLAFQWSPSVSMNLNDPANPWVFPTVDTRYYVDINNADGCVDTDSLDVEVFTSPVADFDLSLRPTCNINYLEIINNSSAANSYEWYLNGSYIGDAFEPTNAINTEISNSLMLIASNDNCTDTLEKQLPSHDLEKMLQIVKANVFTPNGDGINDVFKIGLNGEFLHCANIKIYNRWGERVHSTEVINQGWDGRTLSGEPAASGTYFYVLDIKGTIIKGSVYLSR